MTEDAGALPAAGSGEFQSPDPDPTERWRCRLHAGSLVGRSGALAAVLEDVATIARTRVPVLLLGPTGCGKSSVARVIHDSGPRRGRPFVTVDCANLRADRIEAELFGAVRGAYTGLDRARDGLVASAHGGTLFLDEVGELAPEVQAQLLVFLQTRRYRPMGSDDERAADVRVLAATSRAPTALLPALYWRLAGMEIEVPGLDRRASDVPELARSLVVRAAAMEELPALPLSRDLLGELARRRWPGNVRQLEQAVVRALLRALHAGAREVDLRHLRPEPLVGVPPPPEAEALDVAERRFRRQHCERVLARCGGNKTVAAERLGISRSTLYEVLACDLSGPSDATVRPFGHGGWVAAG